MRTLALALVLIVCGPHLANAERYCAAWGRQAIGDWPWYTYRTYCARWRYRDRDYESSRVYGYERRIEREREEVEVRGHCLWNHPIVSATGDDTLQEEKARLSAQDRWSLTVEHLRGTRYADVRNAAHLTAACIKKVPVTWTEKKQADWVDVRHYVCTVEAIPCSAPKVAVEEEDIAKRKVERINEQIGRKEDPRADYYEPAKPKRFLERWRRSRQ